MPYDATGKLIRGFQQSLKNYVQRLQPHFTTEEWDDLADALTRVHSVLHTALRRHYSRDPGRAEDQLGHELRSRAGNETEGKGRGGSGGG